MRYQHPGASHPVHCPICREHIYDIPTDLGNPDVWELHCAAILIEHLSGKHIIESTFERPALKREKARV